MRKYSLDAFKTVLEQSMESRLNKLDSALRSANPSWKKIATTNNHLFVVDEDTNEYLIMPYTIEDGILTVDKCENVGVETSEEILDSKRSEAVKLFVESVFDGEENSSKLFEDILETVRYECRAKTQPQFFGISIRDIVGEALEKAPKPIVEYVKMLGSVPSNSMTMGFSTNLNDPQVSLSNFIDNLPQLTKIAVARQSVRKISDSESQMKDFVQTYLDSYDDGDLDKVVNSYSAEWVCSTYDEKKTMLGECGLESNFENIINNIDSVCESKYKGHIDNVKNVVENTFDREFELALEYVDNTVNLEALYGMDISDIRNTMQEILDNSEDRHMMSQSMVEQFKSTINGLTALIERKVHDPVLMVKAIHLMSQFSPLTFRPGTNLNNEVPGGLLDNKTPESGNVIAEANNPAKWLSDVEKRVKGFKTYANTTGEFSGTIGNYVVKVNTAGMPAVTVTRGNAKANLTYNPDTGKFRVSVMGDKVTGQKAKEVLSAFYPKWVQEEKSNNVNEGEGSFVTTKTPSMTPEVKKLTESVIGKLISVHKISDRMLLDALLPLKTQHNLKGESFKLVRDYIVKKIAIKNKTFRESLSKTYLEKLGYRDVKTYADPSGRKVTIPETKKKTLADDDPNADKKIDPDRDDDKDDNPDDTVE